jgi:hypothetical protein
MSPLGYRPGTCPRPFPEGRRTGFPTGSPGSSSGFCFPPKSSYLFPRIFFHLCRRSGFDPIEPLREESSRRTLPRGRPVWGSPLLAGQSHMLYRNSTHERGRLDSRHPPRNPRLFPDGPRARQVGEPEVKGGDWVRGLKTARSGEASRRQDASEGDSGHVLLPVWTRRSMRSKT